MSAGDQSGDVEAWKARREEIKALGMRIVWNALQIADHAARSDVELYAKNVRYPEGFTVYDLSRAECLDNPSEEEQQHLVGIAQRAARYIEMRGDIFPWHMACVDGAKHLVRFIEKEPQ